MELLRVASFVEFSQQGTMFRVEFVKCYAQKIRTLETRHSAQRNRHSRPPSPEARSAASGDENGNEHSRPQSSSLFLLCMTHSRIQSPRSVWPAAGIESKRDCLWRNHVPRASFPLTSGRKTRALDSCRKPEGSWALEARMRMTCKSARVFRQRTLGTRLQVFAQVSNETRRYWVVTHRHTVENQSSHCILITCLLV